MDELNEFEKIVLRNLVADHWAELVAECEEFEDIDPEKLYAKLGGEPSDH